MAPFNVMTFLPNFYFGGLLAWIGQDILKASPSLLVWAMPAACLLTSAMACWHLLACLSQNLTH